MSVAHPTYFKGLLLNNLSDTKINYKAYYQDIILFGINASTEEDTGSTVQANNEIWYTSTDSATVTSYDSTAIGTLVSNVYSDGKGVMTFEEDITTIGNAAFVMCENLSSITLPDSVTIIGDGAFAYCEGLSSIDIGSGATSLGNEVFINCTSLTSITCRATTEPTIQASTFQDVATDGTLYYPSGSDYSTWLMYLEGYNWTGEEMTE